MELSRQIIATIVGRCHVARSNREVIAYMISRMRRGYKTWRALPRETRRNAMRAAIAIHAENRLLYRTVMGGI